MLTATLIDLAKKGSSRSGTRTRVSTVRGWRANRYTNRPNRLRILAEVSAAFFVLRCKVSNFFPTMQIIFAFLSFKRNFPLFRLYSAACSSVASVSASRASLAAASSAASFSAFFLATLSAFALFFSASASRRALASAAAAASF